MKYKKVILIIITVLGLIFFDQMCKLIIYNYFEVTDDLMKKTAILHIHPTIHDKNYLKICNIAEKFSLPIPLVKFMDIIITLIVVLILFLVLHLINKIVFYDHNELYRPYTVLSLIVFSLICAGVSCSLIDQTFWNGSLDFICHASRRIVSGKRVINHGIFDIKDLYLWNGAFLVMVRVHFWEKSVKEINKNELKEKFLHPIKHLKIIYGKK